MSIVWRDVRKNRGAFMAEMAQGDSCWAAATLIIKREEARPYKVKVEVRCEGKKPWIFERAYERVNPAIDAYGRKKAEATRMLEGN